jgi:hypothetical protein
MKRQIKEVEVAWSLYSKLNYPSWKDSNGSFGATRSRTVQ